MMRVLTSPALYAALVAEGFVFPPHCRNVTLDFPVRGPLLLHYETLLGPEQAQQLGRALVRIGTDPAEQAQNSEG